MSNLVQLDKTIEHKRQEVLALFAKVKDANLITGENFEHLTGIHIGVFDDQVMKLKQEHVAGSLDYSHAVERLNGLSAGIKGVMWEFALNMSMSDGWMNEDEYIDSLQEFDGLTPGDVNMSGMYFDNQLTSGGRGTVIY